MAGKTKGTTKRRGSQPAQGGTTQPKLAPKKGKAAKGARGGNQSE